MYLLFDLGKTKLRLAYSEDKNKISEPVVHETPEDFDQALELIARFASDLPKSTPLKAAAGGIAGILNIDKSILLKSPQRPDWSNKAIQKRLEEKLSAPVFLENDAAIVGLGEALTGPGMGKEIVAYLTVSTGVGGARIVSGKIDVSAFGFEPGHQIIDPNGPECPGCGGFGDLESLISGTSFQKRFNQKPEEIEDLRIWYEASKWLAIGLNNLILSWSPEVIVLGGSMMKKIPLDVTINQLKQIHKIYPELPDIALAKLDDYGGLYGALEYLKQKSSN